MKDKRAAIDKAHALEYSRAIIASLLSLGCIQDAACVMAYSATGGEPDLSGFIQACIDAGKCVALPCVGKKGEMIAAEYHPNAKTVCNRYGILEPVAGGTVPQQPGVVIVPGLAFDTGCRRIGFGGGYYDRFLVQRDAVKIGVCFDTQIVKHIKADVHDVPMDIVVTEKRMIPGSPVMRNTIGVDGDGQCV